MLSNQVQWDKWYFVYGQVQQRRSRGHLAPRLPGTCQALAPSQEHLERIHSPNGSLSDHGPSTSLTLDPMVNHRP